MAKAKKTKQISFTKKDKPGLLTEVTTLLADSQVNINAINQAVGSLENNGTITRTGGGNTKIELKTNNNGTIRISGGSGLQLPEDFEQGNGSLIVDGSLVFGKTANIKKKFFT